MHSINRRTALQLGVAALATGMLSSCSGPGASKTQEKIDNPDPNINPTGMPVVKDTVTITMMTRRNVNTAEDWNTVAAMKRMEELSNVRIDWGLVPWEGAEEKRNLALASGDYPEILHRTNLKPVDLAKYGEQGTFVAVNTLIDQHMPNLKGLLDKNPDIRKGLTFPDGNIYSLPTIYDPEFESLIMQQKLWVRQDWLEKFGMETPTTIDEFEAYLIEAKATNPVESGQPTVIPFTDGSKGGLVYEMFWGTFGIATKGKAAGYVDTGDDGALRFYPTSDHYRDAMTYLHRLYSQGLIQADVFTNDTAKFNALGKQGIVAAAATQSPAAFFGEVGENYVPVAPLKKSASDPVPAWHSVGSGLASMGHFVITDRSEHPIESARWLDHFYGDEGARLFFMGIEGESYEKTSDGEYEFLPSITDNPDGLTVDEALRPFVTYLGGGYPGIVTEAYFKGTESSEQARAGTQAVAEHRIDEVWPAFTYTSEEASELSSLASDVDKLVTESRARFMNGELPIADWATHVGQFDQVGIKRYLEIQQAAHDRYAG